MRSQIMLLFKILLTFLMATASALCLAVTITKTVSGSRQSDTQSDTEIKRLLAILRDTDLRKRSPEMVEQAIERIGQLKAEVGIKELVSLITFQIISPVKSKSELITEEQDRYPAASALFLIGQPALSELRSVIENNASDDLACKIALKTVIAIFRDNPKEAVTYLEEAARNSSSKEKAYRLMSAVEKISKMIQSQIK